MTSLQIFKLEDQELKNPVSTLSEGEHVIGRGDILACNDKKVSRKHALINVDKSGASITSVHVNPCFFRPSGGSIKVLPREEVTPLNNDDQFALLPTTFWFKVKVTKEHDISDEELLRTVDDALGLNCEDVNSNKRSIDEPEDISKRQKTSSTDETVNRKSRSKSNSLDDLLAIDNINQIVQSESLENNVGDEYENAETLRIESALKEEVVSDNEELEDNVVETVKEIKKQPEEKQTEAPDSKIKTEPDVNIEDNAKNDNTANQAPVANQTTAANQASTANDQTGNSNDNGTGNQQNQPTRRDKCWYGANCYRRNPQHRVTFSHPGDQDYNYDDDDDPPDCPFGAACYRTNLAHRRQFMHIGKPAPKPNGNDSGNPTNITKKTPKKKKNQRNDDEDEDEISDAESDKSDGNSGIKRKRKAALKKKKYTDTPEDDYDLNDSFINDGSSDEFEMSDEDDDDDDSEWVDSQEVDEESQETKRMLKEAKKFTKAKRKGKAT